MELETKFITPVKSNEIHKPIGVYVKKDSNGKVIDLNSDLFITDFTGWEKIDEGFGDKYSHASSLYYIEGFNNFASENQKTPSQEEFKNSDVEL